MNSLILMVTATAVLSATHGAPVDHVLPADHELPPMHPTPSHSHPLSPLPHLHPHQTNEVDPVDPPDHLMHLKPPHSHVLPLPVPAPATPESLHHPNRDVPEHIPHAHIEHPLPPHPEDEQSKKFADMEINEKLDTMENELRLLREIVTINNYNSKIIVDKLNHIHFDVSFEFIKKFLLLTLQFFSFSYFIRPSNRKMTTKPNTHQRRSVFIHRMI